MILIRDTDAMPSQNLSPVVSILAIILLIIAVAAVTGRLFTKAKVVGSLGFDDYTILVAVIFCAGQTSAVLVASPKGIGQDWDTLSAPQREDLLEALYASSLLFILSTIFSKLAVVLFIGNLAPISLLKQMGYALEGFFVLWGVASLFAASFQCHTSRVWDYPTNTCYDIRAFWLSFDSISLLIEVVLVIWPIVVVSRLHTSWSRRAVFMGCFLCRMLVIGALCAQIAFTTREGQAAYGPSPSYHLWSIIVCGQIVQCVSIITACVPQFRPFLIAMESGFLTARANERSTAKDSKTYNSSSNPSDNKSMRSKWKPSFRSHAQLTHENSEEGSGRPSAVALLPVDSNGKENQQFVETQNNAGDEGKGVETSRVQHESY